MKKLEVSAIEEGTVIDQIANKSTFKVANILNIQDIEQVVLIGFNLSSKKLGKKGIIKIGGKLLTQEEVNKISLIAPDATVNIIKDSEVVKKFTVDIPDSIEEFMKCFNPNCVSNHQNILSRFHVISKNPIRIRCHYCERHMGVDDIELV
ncbi:MAG: aspartate carbamoyltransferase regulatory subunit [Candidatus Scalindua sp.]|jgi:aspartate carbamoyltransferase regulatory subunit|nr:aspartate carbamoyltransferase regulatory subunit [Candidatus Scalindua sp.]MBT5306832.1 aspartate carbamoyltransferase regulatory subunit [Candidatus Scalindua sp.]MBT6226286.1 aspartate carbamoyltransferase regulatory subunit [Candidatus Scalindua sp.]MBT6562310.1 aspartate carbamoyltransferase regulatory subunit [Candidatus Scalindua sp.]MBT7212764.1 aspartate carbamoyltransferase regulatory subunit [Candidatus Scalindua sp.]